MTNQNAKARLSRETVVLGIIAFFVMVGFGVVVPILPVFVRSFGVGYVEVGAVVSAFALVRFISSPFVGKLIDFGGERIILAIGIGIVAVSSAMVGFAQSYLEILLLRGAGGIGSAMFSISAMSLLLATTDASMRGRAVGFYQGGFLIGGMAGPAIGGVLALISLRAPFFFYAGTLVVAGVVGLAMLRQTKKSGDDTSAKSAPSLSLRAMFADSRYLVACAANFATGWAGLGVRSALVPILVVELLNDSEVWTGISFAIAAVVQTIFLAPAGWFVDKVGRRPAIIGAFALGGIAMLLIPFVTELWQLIVLLCVYGVAASFMGTAPASLVGDVAGPKSGQPVAIFSAFSDLGAIVGPLAAGFLLDQASYPAAFGSAVLLLLAVSIFALILKPSPKNRASEVSVLDTSAG